MMKFEVKYKKLEDGDIEASIVCTDSAKYPTTCIFTEDVVLLEEEDIQAGWEDFTLREKTSCRKIIISPATTIRQEVVLLVRSIREAYKAWDKILTPPNEKM